jgi:hypothetical protein
MRSRWGNTASISNKDGTPVSFYLKWPPNMDGTGRLSWNIPARRPGFRQKPGRREIRKSIFFPPISFEWIDKRKKVF